MEITNKLDNLFDEVSASKFGPIFFKMVDGKSVGLDKFPGYAEDEKGIAKGFHVNQIALDVYKACIFSILGTKMDATMRNKTQFPGDEWKKNDNV